MSEMTVSSGVPEVVIGSGSMEGAKPTINLSNDWNKDLAAMAAESQPQTPAQPELATSPAAVTTTPAAPVVPAAQQTQPQTAPQASAPAAVVPPVAATVEVPEKFRGPDGKLDQEKLLKSYTAIEKEFGRKANEVNALKANPVSAVPQAQAAPAPVAQPPGNLTPLELQVARDLFNSGAGYSEAQAIATARVQVRLMEAASGLATERAMGEVSALREAQSAQTRIAELQSLAKNYPDVLTPKGYEDLVKVREENPWLNNSPEPWKAAAQILLGQKSLNGQAGTVVIPTPTGAQTGQPLPVTPSSPNPTNALQLNTPAQIEAYVKTLTPAQEAEFWTKAGMKWDVPKSAFKY